MIDNNCSLDQCSKSIDQCGKGLLIPIQVGVQNV